MQKLIAALRDAPHLLAPITAGCRSFHERWNAAAGAAAPGGRWAGEWRSTATGHHGPLRCALEVIDEGKWRTTFHARYARVFRACYATDLSAAALPGDRWTISGRTDLGRFGGGAYEYDGEVTRDSFVARYRSRYDHGVFTLSRLAGSA